MVLIDWQNVIFQDRISPLYGDGLYQPPSKSKEWLKSMTWPLGAIVLAKVDQKWKGYYHPYLSYSP